MIIVNFLHNLAQFKVGILVGSLVPTYFSRRDELVLANMYTM